MTLTATQLLAAAPHAQPHIVAAIADLREDVMGVEAGVSMQGVLALLLFAWLFVYVGGRLGK
jgi:hypothetical protein